MTVIISPSLKNGKLLEDEQPLMQDQLRKIKNKILCIYLFIKVKYLLISLNEFCNFNRNVILNLQLALKSKSLSNFTL